MPATAFDVTLHTCTHYVPAYTLPQPSTTKQAGKQTNKAAVHGDALQSIFNDQMEDYSPTLVARRSVSESAAARLRPFPEHLGMRIFASLRRCVLQRCEDACCIDPRYIVACRIDARLASELQSQLPLPPIALFHGDADFTVPHTQTTAFSLALAAAGACAGACACACVRLGACVRVRACVCLAALSPTASDTHARGVQSDVWRCGSVMQRSGRRQQRCSAAV